ncbi:hypothetical protein BDF21DRAFT_408335 [Thamnidium elegans]|nr:hypothetical protein BDF21DRAFT_408335 [Thamnidium elegans]
MLRVPKDKQSRQKFLLEHLLRISDSSPSSTGNNVENPFPYLLSYNILQLLVLKTTE